MFQFGLAQTVLLSHAVTVLDLKYQTDHDRYNVRLQPESVTLLFRHLHSDYLLNKDLRCHAIILP